MSVVSSVRGWRRQLSALTGSALAALEEGRLEELLRGLEELKCAAEGVQAEAAVALDAEVRAEETRRRVPAARQGRGVALRIGFARRDSHARGSRHLGLATALTRELPHTLAALRAGRITQWRATLVARETSCLSREHRAAVDAALAGDPARIEAMSETELVDKAKKLGYGLDPASVVARRAKAESERRVTLRPAPDVMSQLSALLPVKDGVAVFAALDAQAKALIAGGDGRGRGQIMADTLVDRVLGGHHTVRPSAPATGEGTSHPSDLARPTMGSQSVGTPRRTGAGPSTGSARSADPTRRDGSRFSEPRRPAGSSAPAQPPSAGAVSNGSDPSTSPGVADGSAAGTAPHPVPSRSDALDVRTLDTSDATSKGWSTVGAGDVTADSVGVLLHLVVSDEVLFGTGGGWAVLDGHGPVPADLARQLATSDRTWLRRLYSRPDTGALVTADARTRRFPASLAQLIRLRDQHCRNPWCGAPIRHSDHVVAHADGGPTSLDNGQGLCEACNYAEEALGLTARPRPGPRHTVSTTTPSGRSYLSTAPPLPEPLRIETTEPGVAPGSVRARSTGDPGLESTSECTSSRAREPEPVDSPAREPEPLSDSTDDVADPGATPGKVRAPCSSDPDLRPASVFSAVEARQPQPVGAPALGRELVG